MKLNDALQKFMADRPRGSYSETDKKVISAVVASLKLADEYIITQDYITDPNHVLHIHPTMVVASKRFTGSLDRGPKPYAKHVYFRKLSGWTD